MRRQGPTRREKEEGVYLLIGHLAGSYVNLGWELMAKVSLLFWRRKGHDLEVGMGLRTIALKKTSLAT